MLLTFVFLSIVQNQILFESIMRNIIVSVYEFKTDKVLFISIIL